MSSFWDHFEKIPEKPGTARCILCQKEYSFKTTTTNLKKHLQCKHANDVNLNSEDENEYIVLEMEQVTDEVGAVQDEGQLSEFRHRRSTTPQKVIIDMPTVWDHYEKIPRKKCWARCNLCQKECSYETSICNLIKHLMHNHVNAYNNLLNGANILNSEEENPLQLLGELVEDQVENITYDSDSSQNKSMHSTDQDTLSDIQSKHEKQSNRTSPIWKYYEQISDIFARCSLCKKEYSYRSTITNLKKHLRVKHSLAYQDMMKETVHDKDENPLFEGKLEQMSDNSNSSHENSIKLSDLKSRRKIRCNKSSLWNYFRKLKRKNGIARCNLCNNDFSYKSTPSNLKKHLKSKHDRAYKFFFNNKYAMNSKDKKESSLLVNEDLKKKVIKINSEFGNLQHESIHSPDLRSATPSPPPKLARQDKRKQQNYISNTQKGFDNLRKQQIDNQLLELFIVDFQPFSIVEDNGFRTFVHALDPNYELPNKKSISGNLIPKKFLECKKQVMESVQKAKSICLTIDCWTSLVMDSYFSVSAHFMLNYKLQTVLIHCDHISDKSNAPDLAESLKTMAQEFKIEDKITLVVSDCYDNMKKAIEMNKWPFFSCFLHKLNSTIENALKVINFILEKVKNVVDHFESNHLVADALLKYQTDVEGKSVAVPLLRSDQTQWNSVFYMLRRFLKLKESLQSVEPYIADIISIDKWEAIKHICMILQPFEEATRVMNDTQYLQASLAIVITDGLKNVIKLMKNKSICEGATEFLEELERGLKTYFPKSEIEDNMLLGLCTFLDPRFKIHAFLDNNVAEEPRFDVKCPRRRRAYLIKEHVLELVKAKIQEKQQPVPSTVVVSDMTQTSTINVDESETISIWGKIDKNIAAVTPSSDDISSKAKIELEKFLNDEVVPRDSCPITWWKTHAMLYPNLSDIFIEHCHLVVTSVKCDQAFTEEGKIFNEKRARLSRKHTAELVFLNFNRNLKK